MKKIIKENGCVDCGLPCLGSSCPNRNYSYTVYQCDYCGKEVSEVRHLDDEEADELDLERGEDYCEKCYRELTSILEERSKYEC